MILRSFPPAGSLASPTASTHSILALQLRLVCSNERANIVRHVQQSQPLFLVQSHGKASHPVDRDSSLFTHLQRTPEDAPFFRASFTLRRRSSSSLTYSSSMLGPRVRD